jgi:hypothetical protein
MAFKVSQLVNLAYLTSIQFKVNTLTDKTVLSVILDRQKIIISLCCFIVCSNNPIFQTRTRLKFILNNY